jgi:hypothetical protein
MKKLIIIGSIAAILFFVVLLFFRSSHGLGQAEIRAMAPAQIREVFTGNWMQQDSMGSLVLHSSGRFDRRIFDRKILQDAIPDGTGQWLYEGTWDVRDGSLALNISNAVTRNTTTAEPVGSVDSFRVSKADISHLVLEKDGVKVYFCR